MKTIGEKIRESRARKNLTQAELAEKSGLTIRTVSKYETETVVPVAATCISLRKCWAFRKRISPP